MVNALIYHRPKYRPLHRPASWRTTRLAMHLTVLYGARVKLSDFHALKAGHLSVEAPSISLFRHQVSSHTSSVAFSFAQIATVVVESLI